MKQWSKRLLSMLLCLLMMISGTTIAFATNNDENGNITAKSEDVYVAGSNGVGNIITNVAQRNESINQDYEIEKFYVVSENIAYVKYHAKENCTIVLSAYDEDTAQMLATGVKKVSAEETEVNIYLEPKSLPKYYLLKAFMIDDANAALSEEKFNIESTKAFESFDNKTVNDFGNSVVLNFDEKNDDNFAVLADGAKEMSYDGKHNILETYNEEAGKYVFNNVDSTITSLQIGDIFSFTIGKDIYLLKVKSLSVKGTKATIYEETSYEASDFFQYIDLDMRSDNEEHRPQYTPDETAEIVGYERWNEEVEEPSISTQAGGIINIKPTVQPIDFPVVETKDENGYLIGDEDSHFSVRGSYKINVKGEVSVQCYFNLEWEWRPDFWNSLHEYFYFSADLSVAIKGSVSFTIKAQGDIPAGKLENWFGPVVVGGSLKIHVEGSLTFSASISFGITTGFYYDKDSGWSSHFNVDYKDLIPNGSIEVSVKISLKCELEVSGAKIIGAKLPAEVGVEAKVTVLDLDGSELLNVSSRSDIHACKFGECFEGELILFAEVKLKGELFGWTFGELEIKPKFELHLANFYIRTSPFGLHWGLCPNHAYRCDLTVVNSDGSAISNLDIESGALDLGNFYPYNVKNATDSNGKVSFYYVPGIYTPSFYLNGQKIEVSKLRTTIFFREIEGCTIQVADTTKSVTVKIDTTMTDGGGSGHNGGTGGSDLFMHNATFNANGGQFPDGTSTKVLSIKAGDPITAPSDPIKAGSMFTGWSPDIPDKMPSKDITFTATYGSGNTSYNISGSTLTISGKGDMKNYSGFGSTEWDSKKDTIKKVIINSGVTSLGNYAFSQLRNLETVSIPNTVTKIGMAAFYECNSLQTVTLPSSVKTLEDYAFFNCYSMSKFSFGDVEQIGSYTFAQCNALTSVSLPKTVISVGDSAFAYCNNLKSVTFNNKNCAIYSSANTVPTGATIYGGSNSTAQKYANQYGNKFVSITVQDAGEILTKLNDSLTFTFTGGISGNDYILLNVTGYGAGFTLSTANLEYIDQLTADSSGKITSTFIPRNFQNSSTTLLIGDFGNGTQAKVITPSSNRTSISILNNPGTKTVNYREGIALTASIQNPVDGLEIQWYVNGLPYSTGNNFVYKNMKSDISVEAIIVNSNLQPVLKDGREITAIEIVKVKAGLWQKFIAFVKFTLFRLETIKEN